MIDVHDFEQEIGSTEQTTIFTISFTRSKFR